MNSKRKQSISVLAAAVMALTCAGCGVPGQTGDTVDVSSKATSAEEQLAVESTVSETVSTDTVYESNSSDAGTSSTPEIDYNQAYDDILKSACALLIDSDDHDAELGELGVWETAMSMEPAEALAHLGYTIQDISGDDIPELILGSAAHDSDTKPNDIVAVYTCVDSTPHLTFAGCNRNTYFYLGNGRFCNMGDEGAFCSIFGSYSISPNGKELVCEDQYFTYAKEENNFETEYYHNRNGSIDPDSSEQLDITEKAFWQMQTELIHQETEMVLTPFADYAASHGYAYSAGAALSAQWAQPYQTETADCERLIADDGEYAADVLFTAERSVTDLALCKLSIREVYDDGSVSYLEEPIYSLDILTTDRPLLVRMSFAGDTSSYGISYVDKYGDGAVHRLTLGISGRDGSLILTEID